MTAEVSTPNSTDQLIQAFHQLLPDEAVLTEAEELRPFECDGLSVYRRLPMVVVLPETVEQVQTIMQLCHAAKASERK